jgi:hypothetical protein
MINWGKLSQGQKTAVVLSLLFSTVSLLIPIFQILLDPGSFSLVLLLDAIFFSSFISAISLSPGAIQGSVKAFNWADMSILCRTLYTIALVSLVIGSLIRLLR